MSAAVQVEELSKRYGEVQALSDVGFSVQRGEIFGLIGPNGAGKTTALECILGLTSPDAGRILILGRDAIWDSAGAKEKLGAQLQASALPDTMTPRQALRLCAAFYPHPAKPEALLEQFQLREKADASFATLSGGQKQRLALALAFVSNPEIVVLDEPTVGLDPPARRELHGLIAAQRGAGRTILFTTHFLEEARALCDRVALIDHGRLVALDTPERLVARSGIRPRLRFATRPALSADDVRPLGAPEPDASEGSWWVSTESVNQTVVMLAGLVERARAELIDIEIHRPTLDDAFVKLVGRDPGAKDSATPPVRPAGGDVAGENPRPQ